MSEIEEAALEQARLDALTAWNGRGEIPAIVWDKMSVEERKAIEEGRNELLPNGEILMWSIFFVSALGTLAGAGLGFAFWTMFKGLVVGTSIGLPCGFLMGVALHIPYWRAPRPPRLGAVLRWTAEEMVIRQRARLEARGHQAGELTEVKQVGDLRVIEGGRS